MAEDKHRRGDNNGAEQGSLIMLGGLLKSVQRPVTVLVEVMRDHIAFDMLFRAQLYSKCRCWVSGASV